MVPGVIAGQLNLGHCKAEQSASNDGNKESSQDSSKPRQINYLASKEFAGNKKE